MDAYGGFEPAVGEIRAVRTFRVGPGGVLYPLFGAEAWVDGVNTARCRVAGDDAPHASPEPDCSCGYYAYGSEQAAGEYPQSRHVIAVIACWGRIVAGTRGVRSQYARIEALWLSDAVPPDLAAAVSLRYRLAQRYRSTIEMLKAHPADDPGSYVYAPAAGTGGRRAAWIVPTVIAAAAVPAQYWWASWAGRVGWAVALVTAIVLAAVPVRSGEGMVRERRRLLALVVLVWLLGALGGAAGWLLVRAPLILVTGVLWVHRHQERAAADRFPAIIDRRRTSR